VDHNPFALLIMSDIKEKKKTKEKRKEKASYLGGEGPRYGGRGGTFSPAEGPRWGGKVDLEGPTMSRYLGKVPWQGGTWHVDLAFTIRL
jgi:hypothetical protein